MCDFFSYRPTDVSSPNTIYAYNGKFTTDFFPVYFDAFFFMLKWFVDGNPSEGITLCKHLHNIVHVFCGATKKK